MIKKALGCGLRPAYGPIKKDSKIWEKYQTELINYAAWIVWCQEKRKDMPKEEEAEIEAKFWQRVKMETLFWEKEMEQY